MTDQFLSLSYVAKTLGHTTGRICNALEALGLKLTSRTMTRRAVVCMPARYVHLIEKYLAHQAAETVSIAEAARQRGIPRNLFYRAATMMQIGGALTQDEIDRVCTAVEQRKAGRTWYLIIRELGNQTRRDQQLDVIFNNVLDDVVPQFITTHALVEELNSTYTTVQTWISELGICQANVNGCRAVSLADAELLRERAGKFPLTRMTGMLKGIGSVTSTPDMDRLRTLYHNFMKETHLTQVELSRKTNVPRNTLRRFLQGGALHPQGMKALQELLQAAETS